MSARDRILARIREQSGRTGAATEAELTLMEQYLRAHPAGPRPAMPWSDDAARFRERCLLLESTVADVARRADVPAEVARYIGESGLQPRIVTWPEFADLDWGACGITAEARPAAGDDLIGITGAFCAISETGTLMLLSGPQTHAVTSLLPETHIAVVSTRCIVRTMEDAWDLLRREKGQLPRAVSFVSGPSRTADIEQTIVIGAHGPYRVHIVLVSE
jgi:L-lactate dehydrogenase complex protein LldG